MSRSKQADSAAAELNRLNSKAEAAFQSGDYNGARTSLQQCFPIFDRFKDCAPSAAFTKAQTQTLESLASLERQTHNNAEARRLLSAALPLRKSIGGETHPKYLRDLHTLATLEENFGHAEQAGALYQQELTIRYSLYKPLDVRIKQLAVHAADLFEATNDPDKADHLYQTCPNEKLRQYVLGCVIPKLQFRNEQDIKTQKLNEATISCHRLINLMSKWSQAAPCSKLALTALLVPIYGRLGKTDETRDTAAKTLAEIKKELAGSERRRCSEMCANFAEACEVTAKQTNDVAFIAIAADTEKKILEYMSNLHPAKGDSASVAMSSAKLEIELGSLLMMERKPEQAEPYFNKAIDLERTLYRTRAAKTSSLSQRQGAAIVWAARVQLARCIMDQLPDTTGQSKRNESIMKRYALAESQLDKAIKDPPVELMKNSKACLVEPLQLQGRSQRMQGLPGPAEHSFSQALAVARQIHSNDAICTVLSDMFWFYLQNWNFDKMDRVSRQLILATQNKPGNKRQLQALLIAHADAYTNAFIATHRQTYKEQAAALIKRAQGIKGGDEAIKQSEKTVEAKLKTTDNSASEQ